MAGTRARPEPGPGRERGVLSVQVGACPSDQGFSLMLSPGSLLGAELILRAQRSCGPSWSFDTGEKRGRKETPGVSSLKTVCDHSLPGVGPDCPPGGLAQIPGSGVSSQGCWGGSWRGAPPFLEEAEAPGVFGRKNSVARLASQCGSGAACPRLWACESPPLHPSPRVHGLTVRCVTGHETGRGGRWSVVKADTFSPLLGVPPGGAL